MDSSYDFARYRNCREHHKFVSLDNIVPNHIYIQLGLNIQHIEIIIIIS